MIRIPLHEADSAIIRTTGEDVIDLLDQIRRVRAEQPAARVVALISAPNAQSWMLAYQTARYCPAVDAVAVDVAEVEAYGDSAAAILLRLARLRRLSKPIDLYGYAEDAPEIPGVRYAYTTEPEWTSTPSDSEPALPSPWSSSES